MGSAGESSVEFVRWMGAAGMMHDVVLEPGEL